MSSNEILRPWMIDHSHILNQHEALRELDEIRLILNESRYCQREGASEAAWNDGVTSRILFLALRPTRGVRHHNMYVPFSPCPVIGHAWPPLPIPDANFHRKVQRLVRKAVSYPKILAATTSTASWLITPSTWPHTLMTVGHNPTLRLTRKPCRMMAWRMPFENFFRTCPASAKPSIRHAMDLFDSNRRQ